jgi:hypothetical protein
MESVFNLSNEELEKTEVNHESREHRNPEYRYFKNFKEEVRIAGDALLHCNHFNDDEVCRICTVRNCSLHNG